MRWEFLQGVAWSFADIIYFRDKIFLQQNTPSHCITQDVIKTGNTQTCGFRCEEICASLYVSYKWGHVCMCVSFPLSILRGFVSFRLRKKIKSELFREEAKKMTIPMGTMTNTQ